MDDSEAGRLLELVSTSAQAIYDPSSRGVRYKRNALLAHNISVCMETVRELIMKSDAGTTKVLEWFNKLENYAKGRWLLAERKEVPDLGKDGSESRHDGGDDGAAGGV